MIPRKPKVKLNKVIFDKTEEVISKKEKELSESKRSLKRNIIIIIALLIFMIVLGKNLPKENTDSSFALMGLIGIVVVVMAIIVDCICKYFGNTDGFQLFKINSVLTKTKNRKHTEFTALKEYRVLSVGLSSYLLEDESGDLSEVSHLDALNNYEEKYEV